MGKSNWTIHKCNDYDSVFYKGLIIPRQLIEGLIIDGELATVSFFCDEKIEGSLTENQINEMEDILHKIFIRPSLDKIGYCRIWFKL